MTSILCHDPDRQCRKPRDWPEPDRRLWDMALQVGDVLEDGGARARYSDASNRTVAKGYGRWLTWLDRQGLLDPQVKPDERITPPRVQSYVAGLEAVNASQTVINRLEELRAVIRVMESHGDWSWINRMISQVRARHRPARLKRPRLVAAKELFDFGLAVMAGADRQRTEKRKAVRYRDGLMIALLAARPLRLRNLLGLVLHETLVRMGNQWLIQIPAADTKTKEPIELYWPGPLVEALETYLACHCVVLAQGCSGWRDRIGGALWLSTYGRPIRRSRTYTLITARTCEGFGRPINPHRFRDCAATSVAIDDPDHVGIVSGLLGHRSASTAERYYNHARGIEASRRMQQHILALRHRITSAPQSTPDR